MALFENFPYTNLHELNLDWLIQDMKDLEQKVQDGPVVSVNGLTGEVILYRESNIQFPDITDATVTKWEMFRYLNGHIYGIQFDNNGNVYALRDFARTKLLTWDDIPPEAGVISVNGLYGVVHLSGTDIPYMGGETETVFDKLSDLDDDITSAQADINDLSVTMTTVDNAIKRGIAYLESGDNAINNIPAGRYVFWKNGAYISTSAISVGDTLSTTNLSAVATGGFINALQTQINALNSNLTTKNQEYSNSDMSANTGSVLSASIVRYVYTDRWVFISFKIRLENPNGRPTITVPVPTDLQGKSFSGNGAVTQMRIGTTNYITDVSSFGHTANSPTMTISMENFLGDVPSGAGWLVLQGTNMNKL